MPNLVPDELLFLKIDNVQILFHNRRGFRIYCVHRPSNDKLNMSHVFLSKHFGVGHLVRSSTCLQISSPIAANYEYLFSDTPPQNQHGGCAGVLLVPPRGWILSSKTPLHVACSPLLTFCHSRHCSRMSLPCQPQKLPA